MRAPETRFARAETERARCPIHPDAEVAHRFDAQDLFWGVPGTFSYGACGTCGLWILDPRPTPSAMGRYYSEYYSAREVDATRAAYAKQGPKRAGGLHRLRALDTLRRLKRLGLKLKSDSKVLDAGCGLGCFARALRDLSGAQVRGVDFNPACREFAASVHSLEVDAGELAAQHYSDQQFDLVTSWHCLEHVYDPATELAEFHRILKPGALLQVEVPTPSPIARLFRGRWAFLQAPTHLHHFDRTAVHTLLERAGFKPVATLRPWVPGELAASLMMLFGVRGFAQKLMMPGPRGFEHVLRALFLPLLLIDVPLTLLQAIFGGAGVLRVVARRD